MLYDYRLNFRHFLTTIKLKRIHLNMDSKDPEEFRTQVEDIMAEEDLVVAMGEMHTKPISPN